MAMDIYLVKDIAIPIMVLKKVEGTPQYLYCFYSENVFISM